MSFLIYKLIFYYFFHYTSLSTLSYILPLNSFIFHYFLFSSAVLFFSLSSVILLLPLYFSLLLADLSILSFPLLNLFASLNSIYSNSFLSSYLPLFLRSVPYFSFFSLYIFIFTFLFPSTTSFILNRLPSRHTSRLVIVNRKV